MERITEHIDYCFLACYERQDDKIREECPIYKCCYSRQMHEKLSHYEDLEEQGRLIELPCLLDEWVWIAHEKYKTEMVLYENISDILYDLKMGYVIAYSKEAAEAKLKEGVE